MVLWSAVSAVLPWLIQPASAWRDGPEFVAAAWGLGIAHPAGYPLYQSIVWFIEQFPVGDIVLRNHSFSAIFTLVSAVLLYEAALSFAHLLERETSSSVRHLAGWISVCWLVMPSQIGNAVHSEAYSLFAAFTFIICKYLFHFLRTSDARYYILAVFLAGLGCGNQVMLGAFIFPFVLALGIFKETAIAVRTALKGVAFGVLGLLVYLYVPVRSFQEPSFDWGNAETWHRFLALVTDQKDTAGRFNALAASSTQQPDMFFSHIMVLQEWFSLVGLFLIISGWLWLLIRHTRLALLTLSPAIFLFVFFLGWVSNTVLTGALGILLLGALPCMLAMLSLKGRYTKIAGVMTTTAMALVVFIHLYGVGIRFLSGQADYLPSEIVKTQLLALPYRATVLAGVAWFHLRGLTDIEGMRPDVTVIGLGDVISPQYFRPLRPWHIPLLQYPAIEQPETGVLSDDEKAVFLKQLILGNAHRSRFFLDLAEDYQHVFLPYIQPYSQLWWPTLTTHPMENRCRDIGDTIRESLARMVREPQAMSDPEFGRFIQHGFFSWFHVVMDRRPRCPRLAKNMLQWWRMEENKNVRLRKGVSHNDMGYVLAEMGKLRGARVMFQLAEAQGLIEGARNLGILFMKSGQRKAAIQQFKRTFLKYNDTISFHLYRKLIHDKNTGEAVATPS